MKKLFIPAFIALAFVAFSCNEKPETPGGDGATASLSVDNLVGTWTLDARGVNWTFTKTELTIEDGWTKSIGTYAVKEDVIEYTMTKLWEKDYTTEEFVEKPLGENAGKPYLFSCKLIYGGSVLLYSGSTLSTASGEVVTEGGKGGEPVSFLFKNGAKLETPSKDIQGTWDWLWPYVQYNYENPDLPPVEMMAIRLRIQVEGDKMTIVIGPWSEKYVGTFTYESGMVDFLIGETYSGREPRGYGEMYGGINPETLEGTWYPFDNEGGYFASLDDGKVRRFGFPFIANGDESYAFFVGLPAVMAKK